MTLTHAPWRGRPGLAKLLDVLGADAGETRYVGGCIRDTLLGLEVSDVDLATRLAPQEVLTRLEAARIKAVPTGLAHGTVTAVIQGWPVEVTTLRRDVATDGRRATIAYTEDWQEDAARRDFTINALSADPGSGEIFDYFGGLADLETRTVRFIGDPLVRIAEDHLRILRFFRFHARFGAGAPDVAGTEACAARANDLMALSRERIADELLKLLGLPDPAPTVALMIARGIFRPVLPEITSAKRLAALVEVEHGVGIAPHPIRRLAALLPSDHEVAAAVAARLRLSKRAAARLVSAADSSLDEPGVMAYEIGAEEAVDRLLLAGCRDPNLPALQTRSRPRIGISGGDLIAMGLSAGPLVAKTFQAVEREWARSGFPEDKEALRALARRHVDQALRSSQ
ncbi:CCA tRNA nucleotidyltransferase [Sphingosinicella sp. LHD-64]|uniref:CCA tRNA nucleotidyltransferase n=1 Tax=Sphingosinicella sp. LHD-64 TaxID=3072139 RepID=UPI00280E69C7|nr:CCA tRNA nucleotidyltransferase [Sphingosinicella sp. LHD-64]MDQ8758181.1 CCA tRNA nucleotidyltransferase [Sphingosinicella sp. LHD-64]